MDFFDEQHTVDVVDGRDELNALIFTPLFDGLDLSDGIQDEDGEGLQKLLSIDTFEFTVRTYALKMSPDSGFISPDNPGI